MKRKSFFGKSIKTFRLYFIIITVVVSVVGHGYESIKTAGTSYVHINGRTLPKLIILLIWVALYDFIYIGKLLN